jgi:hypothetical protein
VNTIGSNSCYNYLSNCYSTTGILDADIQDWLNTNCVNLFVDKTNNVPNASFLTASDRRQEVCGCWFSNSKCNVYPNFVSVLGQSGLDTMNIAGIECYYPYCANRGLQTRTNPVQCSYNITQCFQTSQVNLNAGNNISDVKVMSNIIANCSSNAKTSSENIPTSYTANPSSVSPPPVSPPSVSPPPPTTSYTPNSTYTPPSSTKTSPSSNNKILYISIGIVVFILIIIFIIVMIVIKQKMKKSNP